MEKKIYLSFSSGLGKGLRGGGGGSQLSRHIGKRDPPRDSDTVKGKQGTLGREGGCQGFIRRGK